MFKQKSCVYQHFNVVSDEARCKKCKRVFKSKSSNLKKHLKSCNAGLYNEVEAEDGKFSLTKTAKQTTSLTPKETFFDAPKLSDIVFQQQEQNLARLVAMPQMSMSIVMNPTFLNFVRNYRREYKIPSSVSGLSSVLSRQASKVKTKLSQEIQARMSRCAATIDIWADTGISSYLGITLHFYDKDYILQNRFLGLHKLHYYHSGVVVCQALEELLFDYGLSLDKISKVVTDGASNMICALKNQKIYIPKEKQAEDAEVIESDSESDSDDFVEECDEISDDDDSYEYELADDDALSEEEMEFELRITCVIHSLQRVLSMSVEKKNSELWKLIARARRMVKFIRKSPKAKARFYELTKSVLILPAKTRWNSHFIMLIRFVKYWKEVAQILNEVPPPKKLISFTSANIALLTDFAFLLEKFQYAIMKFQSHSITSSAVYGEIKDLIAITSNVAATGVLKTLNNSMNDELLKRFGKFINIEHDDFDPHFVLCALFDPQQAICLQDIPSARIAYFVKQRLPSVTENDNAAIQPEKPQSTLSLRDQIAFRIQQQRQQPQNGQDSRITSFVKEMVDGQYLDRNSVDFWKQIPTDTKFLQDLAFTHLSIPASSSPCEQVFSSAAIATRGLKNRAKHEYLNNKLMIYLNNSLFD